MAFYLPYGPRGGRGPQVYSRKAICSFQRASEFLLHTAEREICENSKACSKSLNKICSIAQDLVCAMGNSAGFCSALWAIA
jgi:hypothetical protein